MSNANGKSNVTPTESRDRKKVILAMIEQVIVTPDLATKLGVIQQRVYYWAKQGWIHSRKTNSNEHWIVWADKDEMKRLKKLGKTSNSYTAKNCPELVTPKVRS